MARSCEQALQLGLPAVAITDHLDFTIWADGDQGARLGLQPGRYGRMRLLDITGYLAAVAECRDRYPDLRVLAGVEIGEPHLFDVSTTAAIGAAGFDRVLGSLHAIPVGDRLISSDRLFGAMPADEAMREYLTEVATMVERSDAFEVLAHLDFARRDWPTDAGPYEEKAFEPEYRAIFAALAASDRILEINTKSPLASAELVAWWRRAGGKAVSFGSDAHQPWRVGDKFKLAVDIAEAAGFRPGRDRFDFWRV
jgi:histidinol-phosphatase (PHP family)